MAAGIRVSGTSVAEMGQGKAKEQKKVKVLSLRLLGQLMLMPVVCLLAGAGQVLEEREGGSLTEDRDEGERLQKGRVFLRRCGGSYSRSALGRFCLW